MTSNFITLSHIADGIVNFTFKVVYAVWADHNV